MEAKASVIDVHSTPKKLRILIDHVKRLSPVEALDKLMYSPKKSALILYKVIKSAMDNAKLSLQTEPHLLKFKLLKVDQGHSLKRYNPGGRGMVKPYRKRFSHIYVVLEGPKTKTVKRQAKKEEEKKLSITQKEPRKTRAVKKAKKDGTKS